MAKTKAAAKTGAKELGRLARTRLAEECAKLDPAEERQLADEGLNGLLEIVGDAALSATD